MSWSWIVKFCEGVNVLDLDLDFTCTICCWRLANWRYHAVRRILSRFHPDFVPILSRFHPSRFHPSWMIYYNIIGIRDRTVINRTRSKIWALSFFGRDSASLSFIIAVQPATCIWLHRDLCVQQQQRHDGRSYC